MASSAKTLPWLWVIEALASFNQVDTSILIDLVRRTPEICDDLGTNAREMVSFRILESLASRRVGSNGSVSSAPVSENEFDLSERCEDVVRHMLRKISASNQRTDEAEMFKSDVQNFIMRKRAFLPKCTLEKLKDAILEGKHPVLASLKERSGLSTSNQSVGRTAMGEGDLNAATSCSYDQTVAAGRSLNFPTMENIVGLSQEDCPNRTFLPSKRDMIDLDTGNQAARSCDDCLSLDHGGNSHSQVSKKLKQDVGHKSVPAIRGELPEALVRTCGQQTSRERPELGQLAKSSQVGDLAESRVSEGSLDHHVAAGWSDQRNDIDGAGLQHTHPHLSTVPLDTSADELHLDLPVNVAKDGGDSYAKMVISNAAPPDGTHENHCLDGRDKRETPQLKTSNGVPQVRSHPNNLPHQAQHNMDHNPGQGFSSDSDGYQDEKVDIAMKKRTFLSFQCTFSQDTLSTADCMELNVCMKCEKGGELLVCSASACPLVVHERCLGYAPSFDDSGKFFCPFCSYSRAISEYLKVKKNASLARKELAAFIGLENGRRTNKISKKFISREQNQQRQDDNENRNDQANYEENHVNSVSNSQHGERIEDKKQLETLTSCVNSNLPFGVFEKDGNREGGKRATECLSAVALERQQIEAQASQNLGDNSRSCQDKEVAPVTEKHTEGGMKDESCRQQATDSPEKAACQPNIDAKESSEGDGQVISDRVIRSRKQENQPSFPDIPQMRRKKVPWTSLEEDAIKEGVERFTGDHDRTIQWKKILEFGSVVFHKGRTAGDLKDKWRNICKGISKSK